MRARRAIAAVSTAGFLAAWAGYEATYGYRDPYRGCAPAAEQYLPEDPSAIPDGAVAMRAIASVIAACARTAPAGYWLNDEKTATLSVQVPTPDRSMVTYSYQAPVTSKGAIPDPDNVISVEALVQPPTDVIAPVTELELNMIPRGPGELPLVTSSWAGEGGYARTDGTRVTVRRINEGSTSAHEDVVAAGRLVQATGASIVAMLRTPLGEQLPSAVPPNAG